jgi:hypothetical protein
MPAIRFLVVCRHPKEIHNLPLACNGRTFERFDLGKNKSIQRQYTGKNDFVGHTWTLPRVYLRYYLNMEPVSRYTGEDVQISYALQQYGIDMKS